MTVIITSLLALLLTAPLNAAPAPNPAVAIPPESPQLVEDMPIVTCPATTTTTQRFQPNDIYNALSAGCFYSSQNGTGDAGSLWPQAYTNRNNLQLQSTQGPFIVFPLIDDAPYAFGPTGNYRVIIDSQCRFAGAFTTSGSTTSSTQTVCTYDFDNGLKAEPSPSPTAPNTLAPTTTARPSTVTTRPSSVPTVDPAAALGWLAALGIAGSLAGSWEEYGGGNDDEGWSSGWSSSGSGRGGYSSGRGRGD